MPTRTKAIDEGTRIGRRLLVQISRLVRDARLSAGLSQAELGAAAGISRQAVARVESGTFKPTTIIQAARLLRVLGFELRVTAYPVASPLRDAGHAKLVRRIVDLVRPPLTYRTDVPFPNPGDMRAWDIVLSLAGHRAAIEAETRPHDLQELVRRVHTKRRDGLVDSLVLVLADTRHNRGLMHDLEQMLPDYPRLSRVRFVRALQAGTLPPDGIVLL